MISQLQKVQIIAAQELYNDVLDLLHSTGGLHIIQVENKECAQETKIDDVDSLSDWLLNQQF